MSIAYAHEKLLVATQILATGTGRINDRLRLAALSIVTLKPDDFPEGELRRKFRGVMDDLTFQQAKGNEGNIAATLGITSEEDASAIARRIFELYGDVRDLDRP